MSRARDEAAAYELLERLRWGGEPRCCPHCGAAQRCYLLRPSDGTSRRTRTGARSQRRVWKCGACRRQFSVLVGTILQGTRISLWIWIDVTRDWSPPEPLPSIGQLRARYGLSVDAARQLRRRLDLVTGFEPVRSLLAAEQEPPIPARPPSQVG